jgi:hypothetical protein
MALMDSLNALFSDSNFIQMLGRMGSALGGDTGIAPIGDIVADTAQSVSSQRAIAAQDQEAKPTLNSAPSISDLGRILGENSISADMVTPKGELSGLDSIQIDDDGITMKMPNAGSSKRKRQSTLPLEAQPAKRKPASPFSVPLL